MKKGQDQIEWEESRDPTAHEEEPRGLEVGISIQQLTKIYDIVSDHVLCKCENTVWLGRTSTICVDYM